MRNLYEVIDTILIEIPEDQNELRTRLEDIKMDWLYSAPEMAVFLWNRTAEILNYYIRNIEEDWQERIQKIFAGERDNG